MVQKWILLWYIISPLLPPFGLQYLASSLKLSFLDTTRRKIRVTKKKISSLPVELWSTDGSGVSFLLYDSPPFSLLFS